MLSEPVLVWVETGSKLRDLMFSHQSNHNQSVAAFTQAKHFINGCLEISGIWYAGNKIKSIFTGSTGESIAACLYFSNVFWLCFMVPCFSKEKKKKNSTRCSHVSNDCNPLITPRPKCPVLLVCSPLLLFCFGFFCPHCLLRGNATDEHQGV